MFAPNDLGPWDRGPFRGVSRSPITCLSRTCRLALGYAVSETCATATHRAPSVPFGGRNDRAVRKLERRIDELAGLDVRKAVSENSGEDDAVCSNIRETIREIFGDNSPEFREHQHLQIWAGPMGINMHLDSIVEARERGKVAVRTTLQNLIARLREKREDLDDGASTTAESYFAKLNLHPRIGEVANDLYMDGHHWEAVFAAAKALVNCVKERSGSDLDGAPLMRTVFSRNSPILAFNDLSDQTKQVEQEGMMHLFEGAVLAIRDPGGHTFPEGSAQRALEYISLLSLLAYRLQETKRAPTS